MDFWFGGWHMGWIWMISLLLLVVIIEVAWIAVRGFVLRTLTGPSPEDILKERYARGEVDPDEYERRLSHLRNIVSLGASEMHEHRDHEVTAEPRGFRNGWNALTRFLSSQGFPVGGRPHRAPRGISTVPEAAI